MTRQKPRTPRYWPRMKVRGARRRRRAGLYKAEHGRDRLGAAMLALARAMDRHAEAAEATAVEWRKSNVTPPWHTEIVP